MHIIYRQSTLELYASRTSYPYSIYLYHPLYSTLLHYITLRPRIVIPVASLPPLSVSSQILHRVKHRQYIHTARKSSANSLHDVPHHLIYGALCEPGNKKRKEKEKKKKKKKKKKEKNNARERRGLVAVCKLQFLRISGNNMPNIDIGL